MKVFAINGSPRDKYNTAKMLDVFLEGVLSADGDAEVKRIDLYKLNYKGCTECFGCKVKGSVNYGKCCYKDEITELLEEVSAADIIVFGSPVFFGGITGQLMCFLERLLYPFTAFKKDAERVIAPRKIKTAFVHTMNISEDMAKMVGYENKLSETHRWVQHVFGFEPKVKYVCDIYQLDNHEKFEFDIWDWDAKRTRHEEVFPKELDDFKKLGRSMVFE